MRQAPALQNGNGTMNNELETTNLTVLPMIAMRGMLVFPQMTLSFDVEREASVRAADAAASGDHLIFLSMQKNAEDEAPGVDGVYTVGTVAGCVSSCVRCSTATAG